MPAVPKSPRGLSTPKKSVPPPLSKNKGAVRAKSGCYTCRIRRKKCDERRIGQENGPCDTCTRLKLECLGFGAKRPDWLRDTHRVSEIRDRIKAHLAAQGMIKGHAGSGSRNPVHDEILRLSDYHGGLDMGRGGYGSGTSSSGGSPVREDSVESDVPHHYGHPGHRHLPPTTMSAMRGYYHTDAYHSHAGLVPSRDYSPGSPQPYPPYEDDTPDFPFALELSTESPALQSRLSLLYHAEFTIDEEPEPIWDPQYPSATVITPSQPLTHDIISLSMRDYVNNIVKIQYLLGDKSTLPSMIWNAVNTHTPSKEAVRLLSQLYYARQENPMVHLLQDNNVKERIGGLEMMLKDSRRFFSADDAMAALHVVSLFLFDGGSGRWNTFLTLACDYTVAVLTKPLYFGNYQAALEGCNPKDQFVVKTTIWFDVLASITTRKPPRLLSYIRALFKPTNSWIGAPPSYSMMSPMGCENTVVWALAETSDLSCWKHRQEKQGTLSVRHLVNLVQEIEPYLSPPTMPIPPQDTPEDWARSFASEIFRTATKLFLQSVESGDHPHVQEIKVCVQECMMAIQNCLRLPMATTSEHMSAIVRSTVFGIFICGALTDDPDQRRQLQLHLVQNAGHEGVGNCTTISSMLSNLWDDMTRRPPNAPVPWRRMLKQCEVLLV